MCLYAVLLSHYSYSYVRPEDLSSHNLEDVLPFVWYRIIKLCLSVAIVHVTTNMNIRTLNDVKLTAVNTPWGLYEWVVRP